MVLKHESKQKTLRSKQKRHQKLKNKLNRFLPSFWLSGSPPAPMLRRAGFGFCFALILISRLATGKVLGKVNLANFEGPQSHFTGFCSAISLFHYSTSL